MLMPLMRMTQLVIWVTVRPMGVSVRLMGVTIVVVLVIMSTRPTALARTAGSLSHRVRW
jgi:hypothetical protein